MKKIFYIIIFVFSLFISSNVQAIIPYDKTVGIDESQLLAKCEYTRESATGEKYKMIIYIDSEYSTFLAYSDEYDTTVQSYLAKKLDFQPKYGDFVNKDKNLECREKMYMSITITPSQGSSGAATRTYAVKLSGGDEYTLNKGNSKIYKTNVDNEEIQEQNWLKICHYNEFYLKFNKDTYETNISNLRVELNEYNVESLDIMEFLTQNNYSCPVSLCSKVFGSHGYSAVIYKFQMKYDKNCIISQDYVSTYRCGSIQYYFQQYESLKQSLDINNASKINNIVENIKSFCSSIFKSLDYDDSTFCVQECLEIQNILSEDIDINKSKGCTISEKLAVYISNIVKWVKYIIPVLAIVLGILDFIKAIAADKDDEMKKAQGRFIKRLIAAALIFIIPFIIEFVLDIMGFERYIEGCGIIDL